MIKNYFKIALRNLGAQKVLSFINISGLSIGLACFTVFLLFAVHEFSFDRFNTNKKNIYRVVEQFDGLGKNPPSAQAFGGTPLGPAIKKDFPEVDDYVRIQSRFDESLIKVNNEITRSKLNFADPQLFSIFSFKLLEGRADALKNPNAIVLTASKAIQLFGTTKVVGQRVDIKVEDDFAPFIVGAVAEDVPANSSIQFSILGSFDYLMNTSMGKGSADNWHMQIGCETYVLLNKSSGLMNQPEKMAAWREKYLPDEKEEIKKTGEWNGVGPLPVSFRLQRLLDVHTNSKIDGTASTIDTKNIWILISIAAGILLIACINFTTLAIGRSAGRAKEVGVRKVMGGERKQLIYQFLTESLLLSVVSAILAYFLAQLLLPFFNQLSGIHISFSFAAYPELTWLLLGLIIITGLLAGIYPAMILSGFKPVDVLKSKIRLGGANIFTKSLVTFQFVLSVSLIISTVIILQQLKYMRSKNIGFNKENVLVVDARGADGAKIYPLVKRELESGTAIEGIAGSEMGMGEGSGLMGTAFIYNGQASGVIEYPVDAGYLKVTGMQLLAGRDFDPAISADTSTSIIVNEALLRDFGFTLNNVIGQQISEEQFDGPNKPRVIIGVIKNFNYSKLDQVVKAQMFYQPSLLAARKFYIRVPAGDPGKAIAAVQTAWKKVAPGLPFNYSFLDEDFARFYKMEERFANIVGSAGVICIFLACLGLFGLATLSAINRTKEIGIRKVLGAPIYAIIGLIAKDFLKLVIVALLIAIPITWFGMHQWLQVYAYRINLGWLVFATTALITLFIAFITVGARAFKTAIINPVKSLRTQ